MQKAFKIDLCVSSKLYDLVAKTAKATLKEMGYNLLSLSREICYSFKIMAENNEEARLLVEAMVKKTSLFVNPNKDTYRIGEKRIKDRISCFIFYRDRKDDLINSLRNQGFDKVLSVLKGELWHFSLPSYDIELIRKMVVAKGPSSGLLANPHSQKYKILN